MSEQKVGMEEDGKMKRLFFLEDEDDVFKKMKTILQSVTRDKEIICDQYRSMREAENRVCESVNYDAFILNVRVDDSFYTGRYLAALIREQKQHKKAPIIFVSFHPLMQAWLEKSVGLCWFVKKEEMARKLPDLLRQILEIEDPDRVSILEQRLLVKKKESIEEWVMVKDLIALRSVKRDEIWVFTASEGKRKIRGARGMMALIEEQIYRQGLDSLHFINHSEIINLHFFRSIERIKLEDGRESSMYRIAMFGCDETFLPSRQYLQGIRELLEDRE